MIVTQTSEDELRDVFARYGPVVDVHLPADRDTGKVRGFAFVTFQDSRDADAALAMDE